MITGECACKRIYRLTGKAPLVLFRCECKTKEKEMKLEEAKAILGGAIRTELRDHAFGDREVTWTKIFADKEDIVGNGYFGGNLNDVSVIDTDGNWYTFKGKEAESLSNWGSIGTIERNDSTGPDNYCDGTMMSGLTLEGVRSELEKQG